jgi:biopolymer transport protein ExbD
MATISLSAAQRSKVRRLAAPKEPSPDEGSGELNIVPFLDIIVNIMMFVLATVAVTFTATIETTPPSAGSKGPRIVSESKSLNLTLFITNDGISVKAAGGSVAAGCEGVGSGITIPARGLDATNQPVLDLDALNKCALRLKHQSPDFKEETQIRITASNNISYRKLIDTMDAVRASADGQEKLFPDVLFAVPR